VAGFRKVLIVELKRGGSTINDKALIQGKDYAKEIRKKAGLSAAIEIIVYVLGAQMGPDTDQELIVDKIKVKPWLFCTVLEKAQARTFYLLKKIRESVSVNDLGTDAIVEAVIDEPVLFETGMNPVARS